MQEKNLYYLHELSDYKIASDYPDVRGWEVRDAENKLIGKVDNLLVNKKAKRVVYLDVEVDDSILKEGSETLTASASEGVHGFINKDGEDHLIIPIGLVALDEENDVVRASEIGYDTFRNTKRFTKGSIVEPGYELVVYKQYSPSAEVNDETVVDNEFYNRREFQNNNVSR